MLRDPEETETRAQAQGILAAWACFGIILAGLLVHSIVEDVMDGPVAMRRADARLSASPGISQRPEQQTWSADVRRMMLDLRPFTVAREGWPICQDSPADCDPGPAGRP